MPAPTLRPRVARTALVVVATALVAAAVPVAAWPTDDVGASTIVAGVRDDVVLEPHTGRLKVTVDGAEVTGLHLTSSLVVDADDVTVRDVLIEYAGDAYGIHTTPGHSGTVVEHATIRLGAADDGSVPNAGVAGGTATTVRHTSITGAGDGVKVVAGGRYEDNWIHVWRPDGSDKHVDALQNGASDVTIRRNVLLATAEDGGNSAYINTTFAVTPPAGLVIEDNWIAGGSYALTLAATKNGDCMRDVSVVGNRFLDTSRYGRVNSGGCPVTMTGNTGTDSLPVRVSGSAGTADPELLVIEDPAPGFLVTGREAAEARERHAREAPATSDTGRRDATAARNDDDRPSDTPRDGTGSAADRPPRAAVERTGSSAAGGRTTTRRVPTGRLPAGGDVDAGPRNPDWVR